jgi:hypothetical protein
VGKYASKAYLYYPHSSRSADSLAKGPAVKIDRFHRLIVNSASALLLYLFLTSSTRAMILKSGVKFSASI